MPLGVLIALYLTEFARGTRSASFMRHVLDLMNGLPSIVIAVFVFGLLVVGHGQSGFAAAVALAIIELPLIARSSQEVLLLVPDHLREAADALGVQRWRSVLGVILPSAMGGIVTGTVLAVARAAGETAPLLLCSLDLDHGVHVEPVQLRHRSGQHPGDDLHRVRAGRPVLAGARLGRGVRAARLHPVHQPGRASAPEPEPQEALRMIDMTDAPSAAGADPDAGDAGGSPRRAPAGRSARDGVRGAPPVAALRRAHARSRT